MKATRRKLPMRTVCEAIITLGQEEIRLQDAYDDLKAAGDPSHGHLFHALDALRTVRHRLNDVREANPS